MPPLLMVTRLTLLDAAGTGSTGLLDRGGAGELRAKDGKNLATLETVAIQRAAIVTGSPAEQAVEVDQRLMALENGSARKAMAVIANAWARGDLDVLARLYEPLDARAALERMAGARNPAIAARSTSCIATAGASSRPPACCTWSATRRFRSSWLNAASRSSECHSAAAEIWPLRGCCVDRGPPGGAECQRLECTTLAGTRPEHVIDLILERASLAGPDRSDPSRSWARHRRRRHAGVISAGSLLALDLLGFRETFDEIYAASAGGVNAAYLSGQGQLGMTVYFD